MFQATYKPGKSLWIAETLSCTPHDNANDVDVSSFDVFLVDSGTEPKIEGSFSFSAIRAATAANLILSDLVSVIVTGWPKTRDQVTP